VLLNLKAVNLCINSTFLVNTYTLILVSHPIYLPDLKVLTVRLVLPSPFPHCEFVGVNNKIDREDDDDDGHDFPIEKMDSMPG
jgi:hypothetical protein